MHTQAFGLGKLDSVETNGDELSTDSHPVAAVSNIGIDRANPAGAYFVPVDIGGVAVDALIDTGSCVCLMPEDIFVQLNNPVMLPARDHGLEGIVSGSKLEITGSVMIVNKAGWFPL